MGLVNGMGTSCGAASRVGAPMICTFAFALTANLDWVFPFNYAFTFVAMGIVAVACLIVSLFLDTGVNKRLPDNNEVFGDISGESCVPERDLDLHHSNEPEHLSSQ